MLPLIYCGAYLCYNAAKAQRKIDGSICMSYLKFGGALLVMLSALCGSCYYLARRLHACGQYFFPRLRMIHAAGLLVFLTVMLFLSMARPWQGVGQWIVSTVGAVWMGLFVYLLLYFLAADLICLAVRFIPAAPPKLIISARLAALVLAMTTVIWGCFHAHQIHTAEYDVQLTEQHASRMRVVMLSDLHLGAVGSEARLEKVVDRINEQQPDLVCIAGDIFDNSYRSILNPDEVAEALGRISTAYGVYACLGNHDSGSDFGRMEEFLERAGVRLLKDECAVIDERLILAGRLDPYPIGGHGGETRRPLAEVLSGAAPGLPVVVLDHNPANAAEYRGEADLILSGHTHRGQIFPGSLVTGAMYAVDYGYGRTGDGAQIIVTSGAGTWGLPIRVGTDCEIVRIDLGL